MIIDANGKSPFEIRDSTGKEFKKIYDADGNLLFKNWNTIQGTPPIVFKGYNKSLKNYKIYGNTVQNGTPSPEAPVDAVGCGVRTEQLFEDKIIRSNIDGAGRLITNPDFDMYIAKVEQGVTYTASSTITGGFYTTKPVLGSVSYNGQRFAYSPATITAPITGYMVFRVNSGSDEPIMLNLGSTALPYEPYGYKIPISSGGKNLLDESASSDADATHINYNKNAPIILTAGQTYTFSCNTVCNGLYFRSAADDSNLAGANNSNTLTYTPQVNVRAYCRVWNSNGITNLNPMLNCGSTQLPYEPYNRTTTPVYVGSEPLHKIDDYADYIDFERGVVVRRIKKLVLTGKGNFHKNYTQSTNYLYYAERANIFSGSVARASLFCNKLPVKTKPPISVIGININNTFSAAYFNFGAEIMNAQPSGNTVEGLKEYLTDQYTAGTPVTIWYVLAEPEETPLSDLNPITSPKGMNTLSTNTTIQPSEMYLKGKIKSLATHMLVDSSGNILLTSNNYQLVTKEE